MLSPDYLSLIQVLQNKGVRARFMEVCGTHTVSLSRSGLRKLLPNFQLISGPGCPVCVTSQDDIDYAIKLASLEEVIIATFGDMLRVPGNKGSLYQERAQGKEVKVVYSPLDALRIAKENPNKEVVFLAVGFETTAPLVAKTVEETRAQGITNLSFFILHKLIPPALDALLLQGQVQLDGFILPGHVSTIIGSSPFLFLKEKYGLPGVITGFEPEDIILALLMLINLKEKGQPEILIEYRRAVSPQGNVEAQEAIKRVFMESEAKWRGLGNIPQSGLRLHPTFADLDCRQRFPLEIEPAEETGCACGEVLRGVLIPTDCPLFGRSCRPESPYGPCMVSSEGSCAAYYLYERGNC